MALCAFRNIRQAELFSVNANLSSALSNVFELYLAVDESEQGIVGTATNIVAGMNMSASLADDDVACDYRGTICLLYAKTLGFAVTAVLGRTNTLFMSEEL